MDPCSDISGVPWLGPSCAFSEISKLNRMAAHWRGWCAETRDSSISAPWAFLVGEGVPEREVEKDACHPSILGGPEGVEVT